MAYPVRMVAEALIGAYHSRYGKTPCPKQLEKLLYYAEGHHLATTGTPLFDEDIQAWEQGPVCPKVLPVYGGVKKYDPIPLPKIIPALHKTAIASIVIAVALFGKLDADIIGEKTHTEAPYAQTWDGGLGKNKVIPEQTMREFFKTHEIVTTPMTIIDDKSLISQGVAIEQSDVVADYLRAHPHLEPFLNELIQRAQTEIAGAKEITVEVYQDPEIDHRYLNVLVRQAKCAELGTALDIIWENTFNKLKPNLMNGTVNLMTDFCPPKTVAA